MSSFKKVDISCVLAGRQRRFLFSTGVHDRVCPRAKRLLRKNLCPSQTILRKLCPPAFSRVVKTSKLLTAAPCPAYVRQPSKPFFILPHAAANKKKKNGIFHLSTPQLLTFDGNDDSAIAVETRLAVVFYFKNNVDFFCLVNFRGAL